MATSKLSLLWQIDSPQQAPSYLFGTMHIRDQRAFDQLAFIQSYIDRCPSFATEVALHQLQTSNPMQQLQLINRTTLEDLFRPKHYQKMRRIIKKTSTIDIHLFKHLPPILIVQLISNQFLQSEWPIALDEALWQYAQQQQKQLLGLESAESQIELLGSIPMSYQIKTLKGLAKNITAFRQNLLNAAKTYQSGNLKRIHRASKSGLGKMRKKMLYNRNINMANKMATHIADTPLFCAVGAGHLAGQKGMLRLLKHKGFCVKAIPISN